MAPLSPSNTVRWFLDYTTSNGDHTMEARATGTAATDASFASDFFSALLLALAPRLTTITIAGLRRAAAGTNVSLPATWSGEASYGSGSQSVINAPVYLSFVGRSAAGRRARIFIYGVSAQTEDDYRYEAVDHGEISDALEVLNGAVNFFLAIDGLDVIWNPYANAGFNAYYQRKARLLG